MPTFLFIISFVSFTVIFFLLILINKYFKQTNYYKNIFIDSHKFLGEIPRNLEIVNLGSSESKFGFDYCDSGHLGMNWAVYSQPFEYDFRILRQFIVICGVY
jgi:hypothetical protein